MAQTGNRTQLIRTIIRDERIGTQHDLVRALRRRGIDVTQATVSRDIKRMRLAKVPAGDGRYRYALPDTPQPAAPDALRFRAVAEEFAREVVVAVDLVLVKTVPGGAAPVAQAIDDMRWPDIAGTLAGEDTIIVVPRTRTGTSSVARRLRAMLPA
jgi:transcriptional regulator of arginine metabolism